MYIRRAGGQATRREGLQLLAVQEKKEGSMHALSGTPYQLTNQRSSRTSVDTSNGVRVDKLRRLRTLQDGDHAHERNQRTRATKPAANDLSGWAWDVSDSSLAVKWRKPSLPPTATVLRWGRVPSPEREDSEVTTFSCGRAKALPLQSPRMYAGEKTIPPHHACLVPAVDVLPIAHGALHCFARVRSVRG